MIVTSWQPRRINRLLGMKAAVLTSTTIINEIDIFNYPFPAFIRQLECTAKEQLLASARKMENKEGRICLDERWAAVFHQYVCVVHHRWSTFPPGVSNTDGHDGVYQWSYTNTTVPHLLNYSDCFLPLHVGWEPQLCIFKSTDCMWQIDQNAKCSRWKTRVSFTQKSQKLQN